MKERDMQKRHDFPFGDFTFYMKLILAYSMGFISDDELQAIKQLNNIRNKFAHNIKVKLQDLEINEIIKCYASRDNDTFKKFKNDKKVIFGLGVSYLLGGLAFNAFEGGAKKL